MAVRRKAKERARDRGWRRQTGVGHGQPPRRSFGLCIAFATQALARLLWLTPDFPHWEDVRPEGIQFHGERNAHVAARTGLLPAGFERWDLKNADDQGRTVAHIACRRQGQAAAAWPSGARRSGAFPALGAMVSVGRVSRNNLMEMQHGGAQEREGQGEGSQGAADRRRPWALGPWALEGNEA